MPSMSIISAIKTLRQESGLSYEAALIKAVEFFKKKDWEIPVSILSLYERHK